MNLQHRCSYKRLTLKYEYDPLSHVVLKLLYCFCKIFIRNDFSCSSLIIIAYMLDNHTSIRCNVLVGVLPNGR